MPTLETTTAPPVEPVRAALDDPDLRDRLRVHAGCLLNRWLADQPCTRRDQEADEIVNEALARAWEKRAAFDPTLGDAAGPLFTPFPVLANRLYRAAGLFRRDEV